MEHVKRGCVGLFFGSVATTGREGNGGSARHFDAGVSSENDGVGHASAVGSCKRLKDTEDLGQLCWFVGFPILLRGEANASAVGAAAHV